MRLVNFLLLFFSTSISDVLFYYAVCTWYLLQNSMAIENKQKEEYVKQIEVRILVHCKNIFSDGYCKLLVLKRITCLV